MHRTIFIFILAFAATQACSQTIVGFHATVDETNIRLSLTGTREELIMPSTTVSLKSIVIYLLDCKLGSLNSDKALSDCVKHTSLDLPEPTAESSFVESAIDIIFLQLPEKFANSLTIQRIDRTGDVLSILIGIPDQFAVFGFKTNFTTKHFELFLDKQKYFVNEVQAIELMQNGLTDLKVMMSPSAKSQAQVFASRSWNVSGTTTISILYKNGNLINDFRLELQGPHQPAIFEFFPAPKPFHATAVVQHNGLQERILNFRIIDKTPFIKQANCPLPNNFNQLVAQKFSSEGTEDTYIALFNIVSGRSMNFDYPAFDQKLSDSQMNLNEVVTYSLNLVQKNKVIGFEIDEDIISERPVSFLIDFSDRAVFTFKAQTPQGMVKTRKFSTKLISDFSTINFFLVNPHNLFYRQLSPRRGILIDTPVFEIEHQCRFISNPTECVKHGKIVNCNDRKTPLVYDYGWFSNLSWEDLDFRNLELAFAFDSDTKAYNVYLYDSFVISLLTLDKQAGISLKFKIDGRFTNSEPLQISNSKIGFAAYLRPQQKFELLVPTIDSEVFELTRVMLAPLKIGFAYFASATKRFAAVLEGMPEIDVLHHTTDKLSLIIYNRLEIIRVVQLGQSKLWLQYGDQSKELATQNVVDLQRLDFIFSSFVTECKPLPTLFLHQTADTDISNTMLVSALGKTLNFDRLTLLFNISKTFNFISVIESEFTGPSIELRERLFFSPDLSNCQAPSPLLIKFSLNAKGLTFYDPLSDRTLTYPFDGELSEFSDLQTYNYGRSSNDRLFCQKIDESEACQIWRGAIGSNEENRELLFGQTVLDNFNLFNQPSLTFTRPTDNQVNMSLQYIPDELELIITRNSIRIADKNKLRGNSLFYRRIDAVDYLVSNQPRVYQHNQAFIFVDSLYPATGYSQLNQISEEPNSAKGLSPETLKDLDFAASYRVRANLKSSFVAATFSLLDQASFQTSVAYIESSEDTLTVVAYNGLLFTLLELTPDEISEFTTTQRYGSFLIGNSALRTKSRLPLELSNAEWDSTANSICSDKSCVRVKLFSGLEGRSYALAYKHELAVLVQSGGNVSLALIADESHRLATPISVGDDDQLEFSFSSQNRLKI